MDANLSSILLLIFHPYDLDANSWVMAHLRLALL